jgi:hypothetical protein
MGIRLGVMLLMNHMDMKTYGTKPVGNQDIVDAKGTGVKNL